jgi:hypothetical protein
MIVPGVGEVRSEWDPGPGDTVSMPCVIGWHGPACVAAAAERSVRVPCSCSCHEETS